MADYLEIRELYHSAKGTSWTKVNHLYIKKYKNKNGKWVYKYAVTNPKQYGRLNDSSTDNHEEGEGVTREVSGEEIDEMERKVNNMSTSELAKSATKGQITLIKDLIKAKKVVDGVKHFDFYSDELYHHGIEGQKWGVQNGPPYPIPEGEHSAAEKKKLAKTYTKELNAHDKKTAFDRRDYNEKYNALSKTHKKIEKLSAKKETASRTKKIENLKNKESKQAEDVKQAREKVLAGQDYANKYVENLEKNGFTVSKAFTTRNTTKGSEYVGHVAMAAVQVAASMAGFGSIGLYRYSSTAGTKYKVK